MKEEVRLLLIRHGETLGNRLTNDPPLAGHSDLPLTEVGREQAQKLGEALRREPITIVFSSPLQRAMDTAACIAQACGVPLEPMPDLREIHCGDLEGEAISSVQRRLPVLWALNESESDDDFRWPGGESYRDLRQRVVASLEQARRACAGGTAAVVTHAGPVTQALNWVRHVTPRLWKANRPDNGSITELYFSDQGVRLGRFGVYPEDWQRSA